MEKKKRIRKLKPEPCSQCEKIGVFSVSLCQACYSKSRRQTPEGKEAMRLYNANRGKVCRERYVEKNAVPKVKKEKKRCECGRPVLAKGKCKVCYNKERDQLKGFKPKVAMTTNEFKREMRKRYTQIYEKVYDMVTIKGMSITGACKSLVVNPESLLRNISKGDAEELKLLSLGNNADQDFLDENYFN